MAKDHRPKITPPFVPASDGMKEVLPPPTDNPVPYGPGRMGYPRGEHLDEAKKKKWNEYWESVNNEFDYWQQHYRRQKWERK